jgi:Fic family protein
MLFETPELDVRELEVLQQIDDLRARLRWQLHEPRRWSGSLRRLSFARNIQGSNSIEGFDASLDDAAAVALGEEPLDATTETRLALEGYRNAMTYVLQLAQEPPIEYSSQLIKSMHFMMTQHDLKNRPGRWRQGAIYVQDERTGDIVYEGADVGDVPALMSALVEEMGSEADHEIVRGAMTHLNLVMVHPFRDGNGRMARALQSMILASEGALSPVFMSVEEYLGRNTQAYYDVLAEVGRGHWNPENDARPWVRFMLTAHLRQASTLQQRIKDSERLWHELESVAKERNLPERTLPALFDAALRLRVRSSTYRAALLEAEQEITDSTASRDLSRLVDSGLLTAVGEKRGRYYVAGEFLRSLQAAVVAARGPKDTSDPFAK